MTTSIPTLCTMPTLRGATAPAATPPVWRNTSTALAACRPRLLERNPAPHTADCPRRHPTPRTQRICRSDPGHCRSGDVGKSVAKRAAAHGFRANSALRPSTRRTRRAGSLYTVRRVGTPLRHHYLSHPSDPRSATTRHLPHGFGSMVRQPATLPRDYQHEPRRSHRHRGAETSHRQRTGAHSRYRHLGERTPYRPRTAAKSIYRHPPHRRLQCRRKGQRHAHGVQAIARHFDLPTDAFESVVPPPLPEGFAYYPEGQGRLLAEELRLYDPTRDAEALRTHPECFEKLRGDYPLRREMP